MNNYFEFYGIPESFNVEPAMLKKKFYELSKLYHPDFHAGENEEKQQEILELSTLNNKAYQVLTDPARRMEYILKLYDLVSEGAKPQLPTDFLMEMMEINERLMEADDAAELGSIAAEVLAFEDDINQKLGELTTDYPTLDHTAQEDRRIKIADIYYRQKYLLRIKESLDTFAARL
ncbi:Fe-S protein assembly co-chaperone HscB [Mucilaginibacter sp. FT3.2]|uniref:Fe-S protein assembly co-chaperone HscB n=1 Tax=Mucilaginibacter sp. FT3.2 TaxID=2723090 RepID=UPI0016113458|nr:Fe-S protein assembly co-chaperone HscB [Mucilaginibacter sp. FT3.2]MBB6233596.1 molecular chaperone HscB [Mucilaginibacter sp. FT3.2]